jgi:hypothetical protein
MEERMKRSWFSAGLVILSACSSSGGDGGPAAAPGPEADPSAALGLSLAHLRELKGCEGVEDALREGIVAEIDRDIDQAVEEAIFSAKQAREKKTTCYGGAEAWGRIGPTFGWGTGGARAGSPQSDGASEASGGSGTNGGSSAPPPAPSGPSAVAGTNNQVAGVDEADFTKIAPDGKHVYYGEPGGRVVQIFASWPANEARELSRIEVPGALSTLLVDHDGGRLVTFSGLGASPGSTRVAIFDISDRAHPREIRELLLSGGYVAARQVGTAVHVVASDHLRYQPVSHGVKWCKEDDTPQDGGTPMSDDEIRARAELVRREEKIAARTYRPVAPSFYDSAYGDEKRWCPGGYGSQLGGTNALTLLSFNPRESAKPRGTMIVSRPGTVYASRDSLYVAVSEYRGSRWFDDLGDSWDATSLHKFHIGANPNETRYVASGTTKGHVHDQFSLDEFEGHLRVATTSWGFWGRAQSHSTVSVLAERAGFLSLTGRVDNLGPGETLRAARFSGRRGYVVTFRQVDPLFLFDLANPTAPVVMSELKIPGFSTYVHMVDDATLLTIGQEGDDTGRLTGRPQLQLFDVSDARNPKVLHQAVIATRWGQSEALSNHLAFNYFPERKMLALPMSGCEWQDSGVSPTTVPVAAFNGLLVFDVSREGGIAERGRVSHSPDASPTCGSSYNRYRAVRRSFFIDDHVLSFSKRLKFNQVGNLGTDVINLPLGE